MAGLHHVELDERCDDSFHQIWSSSVTNAIPHGSVRKSQHFFQRGKREKNTSPLFWTRGIVPAEWIEVPAAWEAVEPRVKHNSCDTLKELAKSICLIMFLDGTRGLFSSGPVLRRLGWGVAVLDFTVVFCAVLGLRQRRRSPWRQANCLHFGCLWAVSLPTDWRVRELKRISIPNGPSRKLFWPRP